MSGGFDLAVLGTARAVTGVAAAAALQLARGGPAPGLLVVCGAPAGGAAPAGRRAAVHAARLAEHGLRATASGRLVRVEVDDEDFERDALHAVTLAPGPAVLAVRGPRQAAHDRLLARAERVLLLADPDGSLAALALAQFRATGIAATCTPAPDGPALRLAAAGIAVPRSLRTVLPHGVGGGR